MILLANFVSVKSICSLKIPEFLGNNNHIIITWWGRERKERVNKKKSTNKWIRTNQSSSCGGLWSIAHFAGGLPILVATFFLLVSDPQSFVSAGNFYVVKLTWNNYVYRLAEKGMMGAFRFVRWNSVTLVRWLKTLAKAFGL